MKVISSLDCQKKDLKVLWKETSAASIKFYLMPMNGQSLFNRKNKLQLCNLLAAYFTSGEIATEKALFVIKEKICYIKQIH